MPGGTSLTLPLNTVVREIPGEGAAGLETVNDQFLYPNKVPLRVSYIEIFFGVPHISGNTKIYSMLLFKMSPVMTCRGLEW